MRNKNGTVYIENIVHFRVRIRMILNELRAEIRFFFPLLLKKKNFYFRNLYIDRIEIQSAFAVLLSQ